MTASLLRLIASWQSSLRGRPRSRAYLKQCAGNCLSWWAVMGRDAADRQSPTHRLTRARALSSSLLRRGRIGSVGYLGRRTMLAFVGLLAFGLVLFFAGVVSDDRTLKGVGVLSAFCGGVLSGALLIRWLVLRGIG